MRSVHYYGDMVRSLIITAAVIMVVTIPYFHDLVPRPFFLSILAILVLIILSGWLSPTHKKIMAVSLAVSAGAFFVFEYYAINAHKNLGFRSSFFLINQVLALIFLFATYFGTKSVRWIKELSREN